jgi:hypothetical protein
VEWKGAVDSLKVGFLNSEGIKKEGRGTPLSGPSYTMCFVAFLESSSIPLTL